MLKRETKWNVQIQHLIANRQVSSQVFVEFVCVQTLCSISLYHTFYFLIYTDVKCQDIIFKILKRNIKWNTQINHSVTEIGKYLTDLFCFLIYMHVCEIRKIVHIEHKCVGKSSNLQQRSLNYRERFFYWVMLNIFCSPFPYIFR